MDYFNTPEFAAENIQASLDSDIAELFKLLYSDPDLLNLEELKRVHKVLGVVIDMAELRERRLNG